MIPYAIIRELCESAGLHPRDVTHIYITPSHVTYTTLKYGLHNTITIAQDGKINTEQHAARICRHRRCRKGTTNTRTIYDSDQT